MITTAVQQASQLVEIQGAPPTVLASGDTFRLTLAANVSNSATSKTNSGEGDAAGRATPDLAGLTSAKSLQAGVLAKNTAAAAGGKTPLSAGRGSEAQVDEPSGTTVNTISLPALKSSADPALKEDDKTIDSPRGASTARNDLRWAVLTPVTGERLGAGVVAANVQAANGELASATAPKGPASSGSVEAASVARERKSDAASPGKDSTTLKNQGSLPDTVTVGGIASTLVPATFQSTLETSKIAEVRQVEGTHNVPTAQQGSVGGTITSVLEASNGKGQLSSGRSSVLSAGAADPAGSGATASSQQALSPTPAATEGADNAGTGRLVQSIGDSSGNSGFQSRVAVQKSGIGDGNGTVPESAETKRTSVTNKSETTDPVSQDAAGVAVLQARAITATHTTPSLQTLAASRLAAAKGAGTVQKPLGNAEAKDVGETAGTTSSSSIPAGGGPTPSQADAVRQQADGAARDVAASSPASEAASKSETGTPKDGKAKIAAAEATAPSGTTVTQGSLAGSSSSDASVANASIAASIAPGASVNSGAGRVVASADAAASAIGATPQIVHAPTSLSTSATARTPSAVSEGSLVESTSATGQVVESHRTLVATPTTLEVGVQSGTQGWLRIRAEVGDQGAVNASLSASSSGGRELLHSQAPALNAFLHSEQMAVTTTVVDRAAAVGGNQGGGTMGSGGLGSQDGSGSANSSLLQGGSAQGNGDRRDSSQPAMSVNASDTPRSYDPLLGVRDAGEVSSSRASSPGDSGRWLNVRV